MNHPTSSDHLAPEAWRHVEHEHRKIGKETTVDELVAQNRTIFDRLRPYLQRTVARIRTGWSRH